jgi:uncharacterized protein (TIGR00251 family)
VQIQPNAPRSKVVGWHGDRLKIAISSPPLDGEANSELIQFLSKTLGINRSQISISAGLKSKKKTVEIVGWESGQVIEKLKLMIPNSKGTKI